MNLVLAGALACGDPRATRARWTLHGRQSVMTNRREDARLISSIGILQIAEMAASREQLPNHDWHPALRQKLCSLCDRTELAVARARHDGRNITDPGGAKHYAFHSSERPRLRRS